MSLGPHRDERPPHATGQELREMVQNLLIASALYDLSREEHIVALCSACANRGKASRCYAAIVRSL